MIWPRTALVAAGYAIAIAIVHRFLPVAHEALRVALAFVIVQTVAIVALFGTLVTRRGIAQRRARRSHHVAAAAHAAVAEHAAGIDRLRALRALQEESRRDVAAAVGSFLSATRGTMRERVGALARDLGITEQESNAGGTIELAAESSLFGRALLADAMQVRAEELAAHDIPRALERGDTKESIAALDLLRVWRRALPVRGLDLALAHPDPEVRSRALSVIAYVQPSHTAHIASALRDRSPLVRRAAAEAARKSRVAAAISALEDALRDENRDVAVEAAFALAAMPDGTSLLQRHAEDVVAFEALEKATLGRLA